VCHSLPKYSIPLTFLLPLLSFPDNGFVAHISPSYIHFFPTSIRLLPNPLSPAPLLLKPKVSFFVWLLQSFDGHQQCADFDAPICSELLDFISPEMGLSCSSESDKLPKNRGRGRGRRFNGREESSSFSH
jgi:hypothetical protein